jgi:hypothetical protein
MIIVEENTTARIKMYLRDFSDEELIGDSLLEQYEDRVEEDSGVVENIGCVSVAINRFKVEIISEDQRREVSDSIIGGDYDDFRKLLSFDLQTSNLSDESFYVIKVWDELGSKLLSQDKMYILPSGSDVATYQPKLATKEKVMNNEFKIYGE